jgi:hypothetical protein
MFGIGTGEIVVILMLLLACGWVAAPIVGIIRASMRLTRRTASASAPILAGIWLALVLIATIFLASSRGTLPFLSYAQVALNAIWLWSALRANRASQTASTARTRTAG